MASLVVLVLAVLAVVAVARAARRAEQRPRLSGRSIRRGLASHVNVDGRPKKAYPTREAAESVARAQGLREGRAMHVYVCSDPRCGAFHVGHG